MEKYIQFTKEYETKKGILKIVSTKELIDGKYYSEDEYITLNNVQLHIPEYWKSYSDSNLLRKTLIIIGEDYNDVKLKGSY